MTDRVHRVYRIQESIISCPYPYEDRFDQWSMLMQLGRVDLRRDKPCVREVKDNALEFPIAHNGSVFMQAEHIRSMYNATASCL